MRTGRPLITSAAVTHLSRMSSPSADAGSGRSLAPPPARIYEDAGGEGARQSGIQTVRCCPSLHEVQSPPQLVGDIELRNYLKLVYELYCTALFVQLPSIFSRACLHEMLLFVTYTRLGFTSPLGFSGVVGNATSRKVHRNVKLLSQGTFSNIYV